MDNQYENTGTGTKPKHFIVRLIVGAIVLAITAALTQAISGIWPLLLGAVVWQPLTTLR